MSRGSAKPQSVKAVLNPKTTSCKFHEVPEGATIDEILKVK